MKTQNQYAKPLRRRWSTKAAKVQAINRYGTEHKPTRTAVRRLTSAAVVGTNSQSARRPRGNRISRFIEVVSGCLLTRLRRPDRRDRLDSIKNRRDGSVFASQRIIPLMRSVREKFGQRQADYGPGETRRITLLFQLFSIATHAPNSDRHCRGQDRSGSGVVVSVDGESGPRSSEGKSGISSGGTSLVVSVS
jgi:hypothetical protein